MFEQTDAGAPLSGPDGLLAEVVKAALERGLDAELTEHVGYDRGDPEAALFPNSRNGTSSKTVATEVGDVELDIPRDRLGTFVPQLILKGVWKVGGLLDTVTSLYAGGMTVRNITHRLEATIGTRLSPGATSRITDAASHDSRRGSGARSRPGGMEGIVASGDRGEGPRPREGLSGFPKRWRRPGRKRRCGPASST